MRVKIIYKTGQELTFGEDAIFSDKEADWAVLAIGQITGNRNNLHGKAARHYEFEESSHISIPWSYIDRIEVRP